MRALYVEDQAGEDVDRMCGALRDAGFEIVEGKDYETALSVITEGALGFDLVVLDRKIPRRMGEAASEAFGDQLLDAVDGSVLDAILVVLTGYSSEDNVRATLSKQSEIELEPRTKVLKVHHFKKSDSLEFVELVSRVGSALGRVEGVAVRGAGPEVDASLVRLFKRYAAKVDAAVIEVRRPDEGNSDVPVYLCDAYAADGRRIASVVMKIVPMGHEPHVGGFMSALDPKNVAAPNLVIQGLCRGKAALVAPLAGKSSESVLALLGRDEAAAADVLAIMASLLSRVPRDERVVQLQEVISAVTSWDRVVDSCTKCGVTPPRPDLPIPLQYSCAHGDMHPGNVLLVEGTPVLIDFDDQTESSVLLDAIFFTLGALFQPSGPLRDREAQEIVDGLFESVGEIASPWLRAGRTWMMSLDRRDREVWAVLLGYAARQLKYADVRSHPTCAEAARRLVRLAVERLASS